MNEIECVKVSFLGDIMCERPFLRSARRKNGYDFSGFMENCTSLFQKSDYVIGNLETPCDVSSALTRDMFIFNAPAEFIKAIRDSGIDCLTTATNHCLDRGVWGLRNSIRLLDEYGLSHTGTFLDEKDERFVVLELGNGTRAAILSYTYGTNYMDNHEVLKNEELYSVNYLTPLFSGRNKAFNDMNYTFRARLTRMVPRGIRIWLNTVLGRTSNIAFTDELQEEDIFELNQKQIEENIKKAKEKADIVIVCPHFGGQFNTKHGSYVEAFTGFFERCGVHAMVGNHPHVVQEVQKRDSGMITAYSLGNVSMSLSTPYVIRDNLPDYSVMLHMYVQNGRIDKVSFSVLVEKENNGFITVYPLPLLYEISSASERKILERNNCIIYNRFLNRQEEDIPVQDEYFIEV